MDLTEKESGVSRPQTACKQAHFLRDVLFHGKFQLLKSLTPEENTQCRQGLFFQDGQRRVDYILTYHIKKSRAGGSRLRDNAFTRTLRRGRHPADAEHSAEHQDRDKALRRDEFQSSLLEMGLELERDEENEWD
ncbi:anoctamin-1-like [Siphateles boraxobius]|uniref:anoctamin-1-like n=1 Tax=Siphateles boraxobius TaxID=180520 RepID=UPI004063B157